MTRNTQLYKINYKDQEVLYRDLTVLELSYLKNISNIALREEIAAKTAIINTDPNTIDWQILNQIGKDILIRSTNIVDNATLFELTVKEFRDNVQNDPTLLAISNITSILKNESVLELLNLTHKDLIELVCFCETRTNKKIFNVGKGPIVKGTHLARDGKSLKEKMEELNKFNGSV